MKKFKCYARLRKDLGQAAEFISFTKEFTNKEEALDAAYEEAVSLYESHEGQNGFPSMEQIEEELRSLWNEEPGEDDVREEYLHQVDTYIDYYVEE